ncbi:MAG: bifunctional DNA-formamidopyrimidine glycosylase/DNA-(apurinic or apyrimidinic site) lyase [Alphaproteobacteria bacterium]|nr:bifunctional DNA-formamidopyrimidine glycosylase/DNA-(apurinic or apyrimidinic site) lyase [Alphaproteobacteria bacterium]
MPELPEVETVRLGLVPVMAGHRLVRVTVNRTDLRIPFPVGFAGRLEGRRVARLERRAKYILVHFDDEGEVLLLHLGMSGRMTVVGPGRVNAPRARSPHDHVVFETAAGQEIVFNDARRFGLMTLIPPGEVAAHRLLAGLGPEPLAPDFSVDVLARGLRGKAAPIKAALLDQRVVAGLGNIYVCEALFRAGLSPRRRAGTVQGIRARRLHGAIQAVLREAIAAGGSSLRDHRRPDGELGYFQHAFSVYDREGERCLDCACDGAHGRIQRIVQSGRSTFFCAKRQR